MRSFFLTLISFGLLQGPYSLYGNSPQQQTVKQQMIEDLRVIKHHFDVGYAPTLWKKHLSGWSIDDAFEKAQSQVQAMAPLSIKGFHKIVKELFESAEDYHVSVSFIGTGAASLPLEVAPVEGKFIITHLDPAHFPIGPNSPKVGDEVISFGGRPIQEVIDELKPYRQGIANSPQTDLTLAANRLTNRLASDGDEIPSGTVTLETRSHLTHKTTTRQLIWDYREEKIHTKLLQEPFSSEMMSLRPVLANSGSTHRPDFSLPNLLLANPKHLSKLLLGEAGALGAERSFLPDLGPIVWQWDKSTFSSSDDESSPSSYWYNPSSSDWDSDSVGSDFQIDWSAYIYQHPKGYKIGYIRIPHYMGELDDLATFGQILAHYEETTDALVIDQVDNPGGKASFLYGLASFLTDRPLVTPLHRMKITQKEVMQAYSLLDLMPLLRELMQSLGELNGFFSSSSLQELLFIESYCKTVIDEWKAGRHLTQPIHLLSVDQVNPHPQVFYSKPIVMLINENDFSAADFMPAILQDNHRAILFGNKTAGAGGTVATFSFPNRHGIADCSYTTSIAERPYNLKIENLGVQPNVLYQISQKDIQDDYSDYIQALNLVIEKTIER